MNSEGKIIIAFLFKRSGKKELRPSELYLSLSIELQWFSPNEARAFINQALQQKLLNKKGELVTQNFDYENVVIPSGFRPSKQPIEEKKAIKEEKQNIIDIIIARIIEKTDFDEKKVIKKINNISQQKHIIREVAAALVGKEFDIYLDDLFGEMEKTLEKIQDDWD